MGFDFHALRFTLGNGYSFLHAVHIAIAEYGILRSQTEYNSTSPPQVHLFNFTLLNLIPP